MVLITIGSTLLLVPTQAIYALLLGVLLVVFTCHVLQGRIGTMWLAIAFIYVTALVASFMGLVVLNTATNQTYGLLITLLVGSIIMWSTLSPKYNMIFSLRGRLQIILLALTVILTAIMAYLNTISIESFNGIIPSFDALTPMTRQVQYTLDIVIVVSIAAIVVSDRLSKIFTGPIHTLTQAAEAVNEGDLSARIPSSASHDELGILIDQFNTMTATLEAKIKEEQLATDMATQLAHSERESKEIFRDTLDNYLVFVEQVAHGDLTVRLDIENGDSSSNSLGQVINVLVERLAQMTAQIRTLTTTMTESTDKILITNATQIHNANEQSSAIAQVTATTDQFRATTANFVGQAQKIAHEAENTRHISETGQRAVDETIYSINHIKEQVNHIADSTHLLSEHTQQIGDIIKTVNDIASQSSLLALNASIEASRAGENGKGFAVLATEIRNLAQQSKQATAQIKVILNDIQDATQATVALTQEGNKQVESGVNLTKQAGDTIQQLHDQVGQNANTASQIVGHMEQQNAGIDQLVAAMQQINQAAQQNVDSAQQTQKAIHSLSGLVEEMQQMVATYKVN